MNNAITKKIIVAFVSLLFAVHGLMAQTDTVSFSDLFNMEIEQLMELTIKTASKSSEKITDVPASVLVLTRAEIERLGFQSYSEILEHITGMYFINEYYWLGSKNYGVRGFYSNGQFNNMVILINGVSQLSDKYSDYPDVKINVPVEAIERIEVIRGPMSVIYGSGAFFGAINIITNPENNVYKKMASAGYGSNNTFNSFFRYGSYLTDVKFGVNAGYTRTNDIDVPFTDLTNRTGALEYVGLNQNATTLGQLDDSRKYANINIQYENFYSELSYSETQKDIFDGQPSYGNGSEMSTYATNFIIGFKHTFENELNLRIQGGYYMHSHHLDYTVFNDYYYEIDGQRTNSADIEVQLNGEITDNLYVNIGAQNRTILGLQQISDFGYYGLNYGAGEIGLPRGDMFSNSAIYSQFKYFPSDAVEIVAGLRMEHFGNYTMQYTRGIITEDPADMRDPANPDFRSIIVEEYLPENKGFSFIPRLAILLKPSEYSVIKLMYGQAVKQPSFSENYRQLPGGRPFLNAAKIETYEINGLFSPIKNLNINASVFYNKLNNLIVVTNIHNQVTGEWDIYSLNSGRQSTVGAEAGIIYSPFNLLKMSFSGMYQKSKNLKKGYENIDLGYSPNLLLYSDLSYFIKPNITISVLYRYIGEMQSVWVTESTPEEGNRLGSGSPAVNIVDANFRWTNIKRTGIFANLKIRNLLGAEIRYPTTRSNAWVDKGALGINRSAYITIGYEF